MSWKALEQYGERNNILIQKLYRQWPLYCPTHKQVLIMVEGMNHRITKPYSKGNFDRMLEVLARSVCKELSSHRIVYWAKLRNYGLQNRLEVKHKWDAACFDEDEHSTEFDYMVYLQIGDLMYRQKCNSGNDTETQLYKAICAELNIEIEELPF